MASSGSAAEERGRGKEKNMAVVVTGRKRGLVTREDSRVLEDQNVENVHDIPGPQAKRISTGGNGRSAGSAKKPYFDIRRQVKKKIDTDAPTPPPGADPQTSPKSPWTPEPDKLQQGLSRKLVSSLMSDSPTFWEQPGPSRQPPDAAFASGSTTPSMDKEEFTILTVDPAVGDCPGASDTASEPTLSPAPEDFESRLRRIAEDVQQRAILSTKAKEREHENFQQHLHYEARMVSLLEEIEERLERNQVAFDQHVARTDRFYSQFIETVQIIGAGLLGTSRAQLFPPFRLQHAQLNAGSGNE